MFEKFLLLNFISVIFSYSTLAKNDLSQFHGRLSRMNPEASLLRIRVDFDNVKFLNKKDRLTFWHDQSPHNKCQAYIKGKTNRYLLLRVPEYSKCIQKVQMAVGAYLRFESSDLASNIKKVDELMGILVKKKISLKSLLKKKKKELHTYIEKVEAINKRYTILQDKLQAEWNKTLSDLELDKTEALNDFKELEVRVGELDQKLEQYRVNDRNFETDRWALDYRFYGKK